MIPSDELMADVYKMEKIFNSIHGNSVSLQHGVVKHLHQNYLKEFPHLSNEVLKKFARTRLFIRVKYINWQNKLLKVRVIISIATIYYIVFQPCKHFKTFLQHRSPRPKSSPIVKLEVIYNYLDKTK